MTSYSMSVLFCTTSTFHLKLVASLLMSCFESLSGMWHVCGSYSGSCQVMLLIWTGLLPGLGSCLDWLMQIDFSWEHYGNLALHVSFPHGKAQHGDILLAKQKYK